MTSIQKLLSIVLVFSAILGCGNQPKDDDNFWGDKPNNEAGKDSETRQKQNAKRKAVLVEYGGVQILEITSNKVAIYLNLKVNTVPYRIFINQPLAIGETAILDAQDSIKDKFPQHGLAIMLYRKSIALKYGDTDKIPDGKPKALDSLVVEARLSQSKSGGTSEASQFVLLGINELCDGARAWSGQFQFPIKNEFRTWAPDEIQSCSVPTQEPQP